MASENDLLSNSISSYHILWDIFRMRLLVLCRSPKLGLSSSQGPPALICEAGTGACLDVSGSSKDAPGQKKYPLVMTNIAMENGPFIDGLPIKNGDFQ